MPARVLGGGESCWVHASQIRLPALGDVRGWVCVLSQADIQGQLRPSLSALLPRGERKAAAESTSWQDHDRAKQQKGRI